MAVSIPEHWIIALTSVSCGVTLLGGLAAWRWQRLRRENEARELFSQRLIESQEQERRRIAAELHDSLGQTLLIVKNRATMASRMPGMPTEAVKQLDEISSSAMEAIDEVRSIVRALRPATLDRLGLTKALNAMLRQLSESGQIRLTWTVDDLEGALPAQREIDLYRIVQEGLNNILKHSRAASARIEVRRHSAQITIEIEDDGCGFDSDAMEARNAEGFGLGGIRERLRILGGSLQLRSRPAEGTVIRSEFPAAVKIDI